MGSGLTPLILTSDLEVLKNISKNFIYHLENDIKSAKYEADYKIDLYTALSVLFGGDLIIAIFIRLNLVSNKEVQPTAKASADL